MNSYLFWCARVRIIKLYRYLKMSRNSDKVYYAVGRGHETGIFDSWKDCKAQIDGVSSPKFRKFYSLQEAQEFVTYWKNYVSPKKEPIPDVSSFTNESLKNNGQKQKFQNLKQMEKQRCNMLTQNMEIGLGSLNKSNSYNHGKFFKTPYTSPLSWLPSIGKSNEFGSSSRKSFKRYKHYSQNLLSEEKEKSLGCVNVETHTDKVNCFISSDSLQKKCDKSSEKGSLKLNENEKITNDNRLSSTKEVEIHAKTSSDKTDRSGRQIGVNGLQCEVNNFIEVPIQVKQEKVTYTENIEDSQNNSSKFTTAVSPANNTTSQCLDLLGSILKTKNSKSFDDSIKIKIFLQNLLDMFSGNTNENINPQINNQENVHKTGDLASETTQATQQTPTCFKSSDPNPSTMFEGTFLSNLTSTPTVAPAPQPSSSDEVCKQTNVDILALNLRLDSFEKRFDSCLKEVGAIVSEMSHIKKDIKEVKEKIDSFSCSSPDRKNRMIQSRLNFNDSSNSVSSDINKSLFSSPLSSPFSSKYDHQNEEPVAKKAKTVMKKVYNEDQFSSSVCSPNDGTDGSGFDISKIKVESASYTSFIVDEDEYVCVYTDGACPSNGKREAVAGIGIWFGDCHPLNVSEPIVGFPTSNAAEIQAARIAIELAIKAGIKKLKIITDSEFLINCVTKWIHRWKKNGWTLSSGGKVKNKVELAKLDEIASKIKVRWEKVEGHTGVKGNEMADKLAKEGAAKYNKADKN